MNTFGLRSINTDTFNVSKGGDLYYPQTARNVLVTFLKIHNFVLNILGYIGRIALISGCLRITSGIVICLATLICGNKNAKEGLIIGHWYDEAIRTGIAQIWRGFLEAVPFGWIANASLDVIGTFSNITKDVSNYYPDSVFGKLPNPGPYPDPKYPIPFWWLYIA